VVFLSEIDERHVGDLIVRLDRHLCVGFGDCIEVAPEAFELDEEGIAVVRSGAEAVDAARLIEACRSCPVDALTALDRSGAQLAP
jgi:ferredoxin